VVVMRERFYSTAELARICGVSISTIKRWTDSGVLRCMRTPGGHRKFRLQDVAEAARRLETSMDVPESPAAAQHDELTLLLLSKSREDLTTRVAETLIRGDAPGCRRWLADLHRHGMAAHAIAGDVLWSALSRIAGIDDYGLHRAQVLAEAAARYLAAQFPPPRANAPRALLAQCAGGSGTLWLAFALLVLREAGWDVVDLGAQVPLDTLGLGVVQERPDLLVLMASTADPALEPLRRRGTAQGTEAWMLSETAESLAALAARTRQGSPLASEAGPRVSGEIFSTSRRLS
jgi:excisionase family DNA binding protein